jgi:serine/threonine protein kinase
MSPEIVHGGNASSAIDVFAFGTILYQIFRPPPRTPWLPDDRGIPRPFWDLIADCRSEDPELRPAFTQIWRSMLDSDDLTLPGTNLEEYHAYQLSVISCPVRGLRGNTDDILGFLRGLEIDVDRIGGLRPIDDDQARPE